MSIVEHPGFKSAVAASGLTAKDASFLSEVVAALERSLAGSGEVHPSPSKTHSQFIENAARFIPHADSYLSRIADSAEEIALSLKEMERRFCPPDANRPDPFSVSLEGQ